MDLVYDSPCSLRAILTAVITFLLIDLAFTGWRSARVTCRAEIVKYELGISEGTTKTSLGGFKASSMAMPSAVDLTQPQSVRALNGKKRHQGAFMPIASGHQIDPPVAHVACINHYGALR